MTKVTSAHKWISINLGKKISPRYYLTACPLNDYEIIINGGWDYLDAIPDDFWLLNTKTNKCERALPRDKSLSRYAYDN